MGETLIVGVDVSKANHHACSGTQPTMSCRKLACTHPREGFRRFAQTLQAHLVTKGRQHILSAMEPSGISWPALYERLHSCGYAVCLVHCHAGRNKRQTMPAGTSKTDAKDAASLFDLQRQGTVLLPVVRAPELKAAYRLMPRPRALKQRGSQLRKQRRAAMHLALPERTLRVQDLTQPTAVRFLHAHPTPASVLRHGRPHFLAQWQPRQRCGQGRPETFHLLYALAPASLGLQAPARLDAFESTPLTGDLVDALRKAQLWLDQARALLTHRADSQLLVQLPRMGKPPAVAMRSAIGDMHTSHKGQQLVQRAGLEPRVFESGSSIRNLPPIAHVGSASLRYGLYPYAMRQSAPA